MKVRFIIAAAVAALAVSAVVATGAQAEVTGPYWRVGCHQVSTANKGLGAFGDSSCLTSGGSKEWDTRLLTGETKALTAKASSSYVLTVEEGLYSISCTKLAWKNGTALGSSGANPGTRRGTPTFEGCTVKGNGANCTVVEGRLPFEAVEYMPGYASKERNGKMLVLLKPASGSVFVNVAMSGGCTWGGFALVGSVVGEVWSGGKAVEVGTEPALSNVSEVNFPTKRIKTIWTEKAGVLTETKASLSGGSGFSIALAGREEVELASKGVFGIVTH